MHGFLDHVQANRIECIPITTIKTYKMLIIVFNAQNSVLINFIWSWVHCRFNSFLGNKLHRAELPPRIIIRDTKSDTFYLIGSWYNVFVVELPISDHREIMFNDTVLEEELNGVNTAFTSHQNFVDSHRNFYFSVASVVSVGAFRLAGKFIGFGKADWEGFWIRSLWGQRWAFISLTISVQESCIALDSLSCIYWRHEVK